MKNTKKSFTLLEMLMVIAVIMILFSMLLPTFKKAKQSAYVAVCAGNQKQLYTAHVSFAQDHQWNPVSVNTSGYYWEGDNFGRSGGNLPIMKRKLNHYLDASLNENSKLEMVNCPVDEKYKNKIGTSFYTNIGYISGVFASHKSVAYNNRATTSLKKVKTPSMMMLLGEISIYPKAKNRTNTNLTGHWEVNNAERFNLITTDGSAKLKQSLSKV